MSGIHVYSEIKPLKKVLLHRPGDEFLNLTPNTLERLLFDDIPYLKKAQEEHDVFAGALRAEGVEVVYLVDLAAEALDTHPKVREKFLKQFIKEGGVTSPIVFDLVFNYLNQFKDNRELIKKCITGIDSEDLEGYRPSSGFFATRDIGKMILDPLPNLYAPRDPFASIGDGVSIHRMYSVTRQRETIFAEYIFKYHPEYKDTPRYYDRYNAYHIEGGDIQVLNDEVIAIGISERTEPDAINLLAKNIFSTKGNKFKYVLAFDIPDERSFMHLDTVMTRVDTDKFAVHSQVMHVTKVFEISKGKSEEELNIVELNMPLDKLLEKYLHIDKVTLIKCGGGKRIPAEREQWSDGANLLTVRPGVAIAYDRNHVSNEVFRQAGIKIIEVPSSELSRGRGGPHCMSMALERED